MFDWYFDLPILARVGVSLLLVGLSVGACVYGSGYGAPGMWPWGFVLGPILLIACVPEYRSEAQKKYRDW